MMAPEEGIMAKILRSSAAAIVLAAFATSTALGPAQGSEPAPDAKDSPGAKEARGTKEVSGDETGFVPLFPVDGEPKGWLVRRWDDLSKPADPEAKWEVRGGVLHGSAERGTWLVSERDYGDFILKYEFRLGPLGNSGCALRAPPAGDPAFEGMELQMADLRYNPSAKDSELTGGIYRAIAPRKQVYQPTEWNRVEVSLRGTRLHVVLNGETIHDLDLAEHDEVVLRHDGSHAPPVKDRPRRGRIGFQELSRGDDRVQIRNARIRVLDPPARSEPPAVAPTEKQP